MRNQSYKETPTPYISNIIPHLAWNKKIIDKLDDYSSEEVEALFKILYTIQAKQDVDPVNIIVHQDILLDITPQHTMLVKLCYRKISNYPEAKKKEIMYMRVMAKKEHLYLIEKKSDKSYYNEWLKRKKEREESEPI